MIIRGYFAIILRLLFFFIVCSPSLLIGSGLDYGRVVKIRPCETAGTDFNLLLTNVDKVSALGTKFFVYWGYDDRLSEIFHLDYFGVSAAQISLDGSHLVAFGYTTKGDSVGDNGFFLRAYRISRSGNWDLICERELGEGRCSIIYNEKVNSFFIGCCNLGDEYGDVADRFRKTGSTGETRLIKYPVGSREFEDIGSVNYSAVLVEYDVGKNALTMLFEEFPNYRRVGNYYLKSGSIGKSLYVPYLSFPFLPDTDNTTRVTPLFYSLVPGQTYPEYHVYVGFSTYIVPNNHKDDIVSHKGVFKLGDRLLLPIFLVEREDGAALVYSSKDGENTTIQMTILDGLEGLPSGVETLTDLPKLSWEDFPGEWKLLSVF